MRAVSKPETSIASRNGSVPLPDVEEHNDASFLEKNTDYGTEQSALTVYIVQGSLCFSTMANCLVTKANETTFDCNDRRNEAVNGGAILNSALISFATNDKLVTADNFANSTVRMTRRAEQNTNTHTHVLERTNLAKRR